MKKQFVVIGLGRFGSSVALTLEEADCEVLAVDINEERVNAVSYTHLDVYKRQH